MSAQDCSTTAIADLLDRMTCSQPVVSIFVPAPGRHRSLRIRDVLDRVELAGLDPGVASPCSGRRSRVPPRTFSKPCSEPMRTRLSSRVGHD